MAHSSQRSCVDTVHVETLEKQKKMAEYQKSFANTTSAQPDHSMYVARYQSFSVPFTDQNAVITLIEFKSLITNLKFYKKCLLKKYLNVYAQYTCSDIVIL